MHQCDSRVHFVLAAGEPAEDLPRVGQVRGLAEDLRAERNGRVGRKHGSSFVGSEPAQSAAAFSTASRHA